MWAAIMAGAVTGEYGDLFKMGILDPAKVTRSVPARLPAAFATEAMIAELPKAEAPAGGLDGMEETR